jgi:hypothetical protein
MKSLCGYDHMQLYNFIQNQRNFLIHYTLRDYRYTAKIEAGYDLDTVEDAIC